MNLYEVDVFEGYTEILLCVNHATEIARSRT